MGTLSTLLALCEGNLSVKGESPHKGAVVLGADVLFIGSLKQAVEQIVKFSVVSRRSCDVTDLYAMQATQFTISAMKILQLQHVHGALYHPL